MQGRAAMSLPVIWLRKFDACALVLSWMDANHKGNES